MSIRDLSLSSFCCPQPDLVFKENEKDCLTPGSSFSSSPDEYKAKSQQEAEHYCNLLIMRLGILVGENPHPLLLAQTNGELEGSYFKSKRENPVASREKKLTNKVTTFDREKNKPTSSLFALVTFIVEVIGIIAFTAYHAYTIKRDFDMRNELNLFKETLTVFQGICDENNIIRQKYNENLSQKLSEILTFVEEHKLIESREKELKKNIEEKMYMLATGFIGGIGLWFGVKSLAVLGFVPCILTGLFSRMPTFTSYDNKQELSRRFSEVKQLKETQDQNYEAIRSSLL